MEINLKQPDGPQAYAMGRLEEEASPCTLRVQKAKERVLGALPRVDLERAKIMTESFMTTEGEALVIRKAKAFREADLPPIVIPLVKL